MSSDKLTPKMLLSAYTWGMFPMAHEDGNLYWYDPDPRAIFPLESFRIPRRLQRTIRQEVFEIRVNHDFRGVIEGCAARDITWLNEELIELYLTLHRMGFAHCIETWREGHLVGGIYGVAIGGFFAGESMFSRERDASKVALVHMVEHLRRRRFTLFDVQFVNPHLLQFGVTTIARVEYHQRLQAALSAPTSFVP